LTQIYLSNANAISRDSRAKAGPTNSMDLKFSA
jgi:hypothetical protein